MCFRTLGGCVTTHVMSIVLLGICVLTIVLTKFSMLYILRYLIKGQTTQWPKEVGQKNKHYLQNTTQKNKYGAPRTPLKSGVKAGVFSARLADRAPLVTTVVLLSIERDILWYWMCFGNQYTIQITLLKHEHPTKQMGVKTNRTSVLRGTKNMNTCNSTNWPSPTQLRHA
jgi:hypothetical protein